MFTELEDLVYEFMSQAFIIFEEDITESDAKVAQLNVRNRMVEHIDRSIASFFRINRCVLSGLFKYDCIDSVHLDLLWSRKLRHTERKHNRLFKEVITEEFAGRGYHFGLSPILL